MFILGPFSNNYFVTIYAAFLLKC